MNLRRIRLHVLAAIFVFSCVNPAWAQLKGDVYFGFSYVGDNLYGDSAPGMKGWQAAAHLKAISLLGVEGDFAHYGINQQGLSQHVTTVMLGPRITAPAGALSFFAHALGGLAHQNSNLTFNNAYSSYDAVSYAFGGGVDIPIFRGFKFRATGDYMGNSKAPSGPAGPPPTPLRLGAGLAYHF